MRRLVGPYGPVYVATGEVAEVTPHRGRGAWVQLKGGYRLLVRGDAEAVRAFFSGNSDEVISRSSHLHLVVDADGGRRTRTVALDELAALDSAPERTWGLVVLKGGETLRVLGAPAQIMRTGASPRAALKALGKARGHQVSGGLVLEDE